MSDLNQSSEKARGLEGAESPERFRGQLRVIALVLGVGLVLLILFFARGCGGVQGMVFGKLAGGGEGGSEEAGAEGEGEQVEGREADRPVEEGGYEEGEAEFQEREDGEGGRLLQRFADISIGRLQEFLPGAEREQRVEVLGGAAGNDAWVEATNIVSREDGITVLDLARQLEAAQLQEETGTAQPREGVSAGAPSEARVNDPNVTLLSDDFTERLRAAGAKSGDVQISLMWNNVNDLDLHCVDPNGEEIFYQNRVSASGGELDVDMNVSHPLTVRPVENVYWPHRGAPPGLYKIYVNHYASHGAPDPTQFTVRIFVRGRTRQFSGVVGPNERKFVYQFILAGQPGTAVSDRE